ncbi:MULTISPECIES: DUF1697 domain-containing protein [unclassified Cryobacterium]|uniref:DUF1697 domain-containing protein n=1 Tax=unclassified Cryobacterium TaxID=2649013 RepID=UPI001446DB5F|nr:MULTISPECIES: DUF1697 domain-containing protein [unclassified Cryobacterium]
MTAYVGLLRGVNVGGVKLPMGQLRDLCESLGFDNVRTYIASGNVLFDVRASESDVKAKLEKALAEHMGRPIGVMVRTAAELAGVVADNPFPDRPASKTVAIFLDKPPPDAALEQVRNRTNEEVAVGTRELYVFYPDGQGRSKLSIDAAGNGTARNMNTVAKLAELAAG